MWLFKILVNYYDLDNKFWYEKKGVIIGMVMIEK